MRILCEQGSEIVALLVFDIGIKAARTFATGDGVPKGDMMAQQHGQAFLICRWGWRLFQDAGHQRPEAVLGMGVILLGVKGSHAGHGTKDEMGATFIDAGVEASAVRI